MPAELSLPKLRCVRYQHRWIPRSGTVRICPRCKSHRWDKPKVATPPRRFRTEPAVSSGQRTVRRNRERILQLAFKYGASNVRLFGSAARGEDVESSDLDFLVDMPVDHSLLDRAGLRVELQELLERSVDVVTERSLYAPLPPRVLAEAVPI